MILRLHDRQGRVVRDVVWPKKDPPRSYILGATPRAGSIFAERRSKSDRLFLRVTAAASEPDTHVYKESR